MLGCFVSWITLFLKTDIRLWHYLKGFYLKVSKSSSFSPAQTVSRQKRKIITQVNIPGNENYTDKMPGSWGESISNITQAQTNVALMVLYLWQQIQLRQDSSYIFLRVVLQLCPTSHLPAFSYIRTFWVRGSVWITHTKHLIFMNLPNPIISEG